MFNSKIISTSNVSKFKTFILPYFDYCATLCIYFPKFIIQKLANTYNNCIFKLFDTKTISGTIINNSDDFNNWNFLLYDKYVINYFQHRLLLRLSMFIYKILKFNDSPTNLVNTFKKNSQLNKRYALRNANNFTIPSKVNLTITKKKRSAIFLVNL